jgi:hypothetical protein
MRTIEINGKTYTFTKLTELSDDECGLCKNCAFAKNQEACLEVGNVCLTDDRYAWEESGESV